MATTMTLLVGVIPAVSACEHPGSVAPVKQAPPPTRTAAPMSTGAPTPTHPLTSTGPETGSATTTPRGTPADLAAQVASWPTSSLPDPADWPQVHRDDEGVVRVVLGSVDVALPREVQALASPEPTRDGWLFRGLTATHTGGGLDRAEVVVHVTRHSTSAQIVARSYSIDALLVSPEGDSFVWVGSASSDQSWDGARIMGVHDLGGGDRVVPVPEDAGTLATWRGHELTFVLARQWDPAGDQRHDVERPVTVYDTAGRRWVTPATSVQLEQALPFGAVGGDVGTALVQVARSGAVACWHVMTGRDVAKAPVSGSCGTDAELSGRGRYALFHSGSSGRFSIVALSGAPVVQPPLAGLRLVRWQSDSILLASVSASVPVEDSSSSSSPAPEGELVQPVRFDVATGHGVRVGPPVPDGAIDEPVLRLRP